MKKVIYLALISLISFISFSCDDSFEPKTDFTEKYVLNCIVNGDSLVQLASLSRSYDVPGFDPYTNNVDPYIKNALIYIKYKGNTYQMRDTAVERTDTSRYKGPVNIYTISSFKPQSNDSIEVIAIPKDGITLRAKTKIPAKTYINSSISSILNQQTDITFNWSSRDQDVFFLPRLKIYYTLRNETPSRLYWMEVPTFIDDTGKNTYPQITKVGSVYYANDVLDRTMLKISENKDKANYKFLRLELEIKIFDEFLSNYISSTNLFYNDISIRLDEPNYSNVEGGFGVVGSTVIISRAVGLSQDYIEALGYTP